ncbi:hypothetical protein PO124_34130 [Bacillus licheniformis]|nr:hypothetical protein [Bacillus licheniformis]
MQLEISTPQREAFFGVRPVDAGKF